MLLLHRRPCFPRALATIALALGIAISGGAAAEAHPLGFGHRGGSKYRPESTLVAHDFSLDGGADGLELDLWLSADGVPVVHHDYLLNRTTDGSGPVTDKTLAELKTLDAGSWFAPEYAGEQIPTLVEALDLIEGRGLIMLDIKDKDFAGTIAQTIQNHGFPMDDVWVWNRDGAGAAFQDFVPDAKIISAVAPAKDYEEQLYTFLDRGFVGVDQVYTLATEEEVELAHSYGLLYMTHTVLSPDFSQQIALGADLLVASAPTLLAQQLPGPVPECSDGVDNDGDGDIDELDTSCFGVYDTTEEDPCSDGVDNDGDGLIDHPADPGCFAPYSSTESPACSDGVDNNGDGDVDYPSDVGCFALFDQGEQSVCDDGLDNDADGLIDLADPDCPTASTHGEVAQCLDGIDNDGDGLIDLADPNCGSLTDPFEGTPPPVPALSAAGRALAVAALLAAAGLALRRLRGA